MGIDLQAEVEHAKFRDDMIAFLNVLGISVPNQEEFSDTELGDYIVETLRKNELTEL